MPNRHAPLELFGASLTRKLAPTPRGSRRPAARAELRGTFVASALAARQEVARYGQVMEAADVHKWLLALAGGGKAARPRARKLLK